MDNILQEQLYQDLAWEGLIYNDIAAWKEIYSDAERTKIKNVINNYINKNKLDTCTN